ncbi:MAG: hypothetical protein IPM32_14375 [Ignavibacteriae bacterium]|nr:hypothetical protein [Ignavibacteriota bacterium]
MIKEKDSAICGICGEKIEKNIRKVGITINLEDGGTQHIFTHIKCLKKVLHKSVPVALWEDEE